MTTVTSVTRARNVAYLKRIAKLVNQDSMEVAASIIQYYAESKVRDIITADNLIFKLINNNKRTRYSANNKFNKTIIATQVNDQKSEPEIEQTKESVATKLPDENIKHIMDFLPRDRDMKSPDAELFTVPNGGGRTIIRPCRIVRGRIWKVLSNNIWYVRRLLLRRTHIAEILTNCNIREKDDVHDLAVCQEDFDMCIKFRKRVEYFFSN